MDEPGTIEIRIEVRETLSPLRVGGLSRSWQLRGDFDFRSGARHGRRDAGADLRAVLHDARRRQRLGLATVREIVQQHEGAVGVESIVGSGTRFDIWLPKASSREPITVQQAPGTAGRGLGETVLVLETNRETAAAA